MKSFLSRRFALGALLWGALWQAPVIAQDAPLNPPPSAAYAWRNVEINGGGFVSGVLFHPTQRGLIYARTDIGGAYRWNPQTRRWIPLTDQFGAAEWNFYGIESLAVDSTDANRLYAAVGTYTNDWAGNGAILRSMDRGDSWQRTDLPFKNGGNEPGRGMGERLIVDPKNPQTLFFGTRRNGLWKSGDFGAKWNKIATFPAPENENGIGISLLTFGPDNTLYAGVASDSANLYQSDDAGATWKTVAGAPQGMFPHHGVFASDGTFYLTYSNGPGPNDVTAGAVWKRDAAGDWTNITPDAGTGFGYAGLAVDAQHPQTLMVSSLDRWALGDDVLRSTDGGATWHSTKAHSTRDSSAAPYLNWGKPEAELGHWIGSVAIDPFDGGHALYVTGATIWGSDNAGAIDSDATSNWDVRAAGIEEVSVSKLISPPIGPHLISGMGDIGGFVHNDLTVSPPQGMMNNPRLSHNTGLDFAGQLPQIIVRSGDNRGAISLDSGANWTEFAAKPAENRDQGAIAISADATSVVWATSAEDAATGAAYSRDRGASWTQSEGLPAKAVVISDRVAPATFYSLDAKAKRLLVSTDGGAHFAARGAALGDGFSKVFASPQNTGDLWITGAAGLSHSQNGGQSWTKIASVTAAETLGFGQAAPNAQAPALFIVGTVGGVRAIFRSDDAGASWIRINDDAHQWGSVGQSITGDPRVFGRVFIATNGRGIIWGELAKRADGAR